MGVVEITSQEQFTSSTTTEAGGKLIVLFFYTVWAEPCAAAGKIFEALSEEESKKEVVFLKICADEQPAISELFEVSSVPYFVFIRAGEIVRELSGVNPKQFVSVLNELSGTDTKNTTEGSGSPLNIEEEEGQEEEEEETEEQLNERLQKLTKAAPVMLFMKGTPSEPKCGFSRQMVGILREYQIRFGFFDILKDDNVRQGLKKFSDWPTFPQLYINGEFQGGLDIIKESLEEDPEFFQHTLTS